MTLVLNARGDITLEAVRRVAWQGEDVAVGEAGMARIAEVRAAFLAYIANDPQASVYGVNRGQGEMKGVIEFVLWHQVGIMKNPTQTDHLFVQAQGGERLHQRLHLPAFIFFGGLIQLRQYEV